MSSNSTAPQRWQRLKRVLLLATVLLLVRCSLPGSSNSPEDDHVLTFGATISITGKTAKEGEYALDGYQIFVQTINERGGIQVGDTTYTLKLRYYDDQSEPQRTAQLYEKLITEDKVDFLLGPYGSAPTAAAAPIAEKYRIPLVAAHGSASQIYNQGYQYVVGIQTPAKNYLRGVIDAILLKDPRIQTIATLSEDDPFSQEVAEGAAAYAQVKGLEVVYSAVYPATTQDVTPLLMEIKAYNPDILLGAGHLQEALLIVKQAKSLNLSPKAIGLSVGPSSPQFRENLRADANYILGATQWTPALRYQGDDIWQTPAAFAEAFKASYPNYKSVPYQAAESTAALIVFQQALEKAATIDRQQVRDAILGLDIVTFFGPIVFDERGVNSSKSMAVEQLQPDGKKYTVFPLEVAEKAILYPMPPWGTR